MHVNSNTRKVSDQRKVFRHTPKFQTHADPRQILNPRKNLLTHSKIL